MRRSAFFPGIPVPLALLAGALRVPSASGLPFPQSDFVGPRELPRLAEGAFAFPVGIFPDFPAQIWRACP
uniref:Putative secreted protein n=1 Tax=Anopheles darlingi TaxID=43151 RepID=A0A2M4DR84_ANODA